MANCSVRYRIDFHYLAMGCSQWESFAFYLHILMYHNILGNGKVIHIALLVMLFREFLHQREKLQLVFNQKVGNLCGLVRRFHWPYLLSSSCSALLCEPVLENLSTYFTLCLHLFTLLSTFIRSNKNELYYDVCAVLWKTSKEF